MNLAIDYLVRSDKIKRFFETPCSLFLTNNETGEKKVIILKNDLQNKKILNVSHWNLCNYKSKDNRPNIINYKINRFNVFRDSKVVISNHSLMEYNESPIESGLNSYRGAMNQKRYEYFLNNFLNSKNHKIIKETWLWKAFNDFYFPQINYGESKYYLFPISNHQVTVRKRRPIEWKHWLKWKHNLLFNCKVATELIFNQEYEKDSNLIIFFE